MDSTTQLPAKGSLIGLQRIYPLHSSQNVNQSNECESIFHLFEYAFLLPENDDCHFLVSGEMLASVCVLYNIGLTYHLRGLSSTSEGDRSMMFRKALDIYGKGLKLMNTSCEEGVDADDLLVILAILNNMGAIHSYYCRRHQMIRCMSMIHELLENSMEQSVMMIEDCCFDFFLVFLIMNPRNCLTTSPAA
jgi:hypothetical protein